MEGGGEVCWRVGGDAWGRRPKGLLCRKTILIEMQPVERPLAHRWSHLGQYARSPGVPPVNVHNVEQLLKAIRRSRPVIEHFFRECQRVFGFCPIDRCIA